MYILGATILISGLFLTRGQADNSTEIVYASTFVPFDASFSRITNVISSISDNKHESDDLDNQSLSPLVTLVDIDLHELNMNCADKNIDDCSELVLGRYYEAEETE